MAAATILFCDIVGFSRKPTDIQKKLVESISSEILYSVRTSIIKPFNETNVVALPTGDGAALAFLHRDSKEWTIDSIIELSIKLHLWARKNTNSNNYVSVRVGIHVGQVEFVADINGRTNICGDSINYTQRIMDAANPRQTLLSDSAFREYFADQSFERNLTIDGDCISIKASIPVETYAKHSMRMFVHSLLLNNKDDWYDNQTPLSKNMMLISTTPLPKEITGVFAQNFEKASNIALIQLTGNRLLEKLNQRIISLSPDLEKFWVCMPSEKSFNTGLLNHLLEKGINPSETLDQWKEYLRNLKDERKNIDLKLITFDDPPYYGASYIDWQQQGGKIHVSPYIWSVEAINCPGFDLQWIGQKEPNPYSAYVKGLKHLVDYGKNNII